MSVTTIAEPTATHGDVVVIPRSGRIGRVESVPGDYAKHGKRTLYLVRELGTGTLVTTRHIRVLTPAERDAAIDGSGEGTYDIPAAGAARGRTMTTLYTGRPEHALENVQDLITDLVHYARAIEAEMPDAFTPGETVERAVRIATIEVDEETEHGQAHALPRATVAAAAATGPAASLTITRTGDTWSEPSRRALLNAVDAAITEGAPVMGVQLRLKGRPAPVVGALYSATTSGLLSLELPDGRNHHVYLAEVEALTLP